MFGLLSHSLLLSVRMHRSYKNMNDAAMQTNSGQILGSYRYTYPPGGIDNVTFTAKALRAFEVSPSPLLNRGDRKRPNAYSFTKTHLDYPKGEIRRENGIYGVQLWEGDLAPFFGSDPQQLVMRPTTSYTNVRNKALSKLYERIKSSEINFSVTAGESRETYTLLRTVALSAGKTLLDLKAAIRRGKKTPEVILRKILRPGGKAVTKGLLNPLQTVGGFQLLWSLALKPLIADVENYRNHMASAHDNTMELHFDSRASDLHEAQCDNVDVGGGVLRSEYIFESTRVEFGVNLRITDMPAFEDWRIGMTVRPSLAWELTTLSFLCDYFVNIGEFIQLQEAALMNNGISFVHGYETLSTRLQTETTEDFLTYFGGYPATHHWDAAKSVNSKNRTVLTSFPVPYGVTVKLPSAATPLLNIAALLSQLLTRHG